MLSRVQSDYREVITWYNSGLRENALSRRGSDYVVRLASVRNHLDGALISRNSSRMHDPIYYYLLSIGDAFIYGP